MQRSTSLWLEMEQNFSFYADNFHHDAPFPQCFPENFPCTLCIHIYFTLPSISFCFQCST
uniref:Uncharacterized protein n=1 Tax=Rhizophora mucronata TaxID=61149 RepID=A0A2P2N7A7_RHIMU